MKRRLVVAVTVLALLTSAAILWSIVANRPSISFGNYERIQVGMTERQVEAILGGSPRWEIEAERPKEARLHKLSGNVFWPAEWWGRAGVITVYYDTDGIVYDKSFEELPFEAKPPSFWDYLLFRAR